MKTLLIESQYIYQYSKPENGITVGGTQRYALEIASFFKSIGWNVIIGTKCIKDYYEKYLDIEIIGFKAPFGTKGNRCFSKKIYKFCNNNKIDLVCYSDMNLAFWKCFKNSFALQHGISWDNPNKKIKNFIEYIGYKNTIKKFRKVICVDTNYINWIRERSKWYFNNPNTLVYIPNFADNNQFVYQYQEYKVGDEFVLLYPRRLRKMRGYDLFVKMCQVLKKDGYNVKPVLAFDDFKEEEFLKEYGDFVTEIEINHPKMSEIHKLYYRSFLSYVPTRWSEGTSLSAIESMCSGCPVIGTYVGGIGNIILPGFNGDLCAPSVESMVEVTKKYLDNPNLRNELSKNCKKMSEIFGTKTWRSKFRKALAEFVDENEK